ncbi:MAG: helix-turn-helix domain-containing protein [Halobacteriales archaeon]|nr:helix-turn-helix domain-containing protein [Halobacteriales archaeon]
MRELVFVLDYTQGCNEVADTLAEHPDASIRSLSLHATDRSLWRVDHVEGSSDALEDIEEAFLNSDYYADCLTEENCGASQTTQVLEHTDDRLVLYSFWERTETCASVPHIALDHLGEGVLFETNHRERRYRWRVIHSGDGDVRGFLEETERAVGDCAEMVVVRSVDTSRSDTRSKNAGDGAPDLSPEQAVAVRTAVENGYYETPRRVTAAELAERVGIARSTLTYRLRRAEEKLAKNYVDSGRSAKSIRTL